MHYQMKPFHEAKLVTCINGSVFDVIVDVRPNSKTFGKYFHIELNSRTYNSILIPEGCAHGLQTLTENVTMLYAHSARYNQSSERTINPLDKTLGIQWPLPIYDISDKDKNGETFRSVSF